MLASNTPSMPQVVRLARWEWFKVRRLRMPWTLLAIALLVSQLGIWVNYLAYHNETVQEIVGGGTASYSVSWDEAGHTSLKMTCADVANDRTPAGFYELTEQQRSDFLDGVAAWRAGGPCDNFPSLPELRKGFTVPHSITASMSGFSSLGPVAIGPLLVMILAASLVGTEYGWGTLRTVLSGGAARWKFLSAKLLLLALLCACVLTVISLVSVASSLAAALIPPGETGGLPDAGRWSEVVVMFFKTVSGLLPLVALSVLATVLTASRGVGIALSVGYTLVELLIAPLLHLNDTLADVADYLLIESFRSWTAMPGIDGSSDELQGLIPIVAYTVLLVAAALWVFSRRDIGGAIGD